MRNIYPPPSAHDDQESNGVTSNAIIRGFFMAIFFGLFMIVRFCLWLVVFFQFLAHLFTGQPSEQGTRWGAALSAWMYAVMLFMTYNTERMPFPFTNISASKTPEKD